MRQEQIDHKEKKKKIMYDGSDLFEGCMDPFDKSKHVPPLLDCISI